MPAATTATGERLGPQLFADGEPNSEWGLEELGLYARLQYEQILDSDRALLPAYWRVGRALVRQSWAIAGVSPRQVGTAPEGPGDPPNPGFQGAGN